MEVSSSGVGYPLRILLISKDIEPVPGTKKYQASPKAIGNWLVPPWTSAVDPN